MPDFDIDFCQDRRDEVIRYVQNKYGHDRVAQIITFGKLQARAALRDVGRVLQMPYRSEEHTSELQSLMRISYAVFCLKKKTLTKKLTSHNQMKQTEYIKTE